MEIKAMPCSCISNEKDRLIWVASSNGEFDLTSAYNLANKLLDPFNTFNGKWIWKMKVLPKIQSFVWMCYHNSIATRDCLAKRGVQVNPTCPRCFQADESIIHMLWDCPFSTACWQNLGPQFLDPRFFSQDFQSWLEDNCRKRSFSITSTVPWNTLFAFGIWSIWLHNNKVVFQNCAPTTPIQYEITHRAVEFFHCAQNVPFKNPRLERLVRWERPYRSQFKLNTDGSAIGNPGTAGGGGILRDDQGIWVKGFARNIRTTISFLAELLGPQRWSHSAFRPPDHCFRSGFGC